MLTESISILEFTESELRENTVAAHYKVAWLNAGHALIHVNNTPVQLKKGTLSFIKPSQSVQVSQLSKNLSGTIIRFDEPFLAGIPDDIRTNIFKNLGLVVYFKLSDDELRSCNKLGSLIKREVAEQALFAEKQVLALSTQLIIHLARIRMREYETTRIDSDRTSQLFIEFIKQVESNFKARPTISQLAESMAISERHLSRVCQNCAGLSPRQILESRINLEAIKLLTDHERTVSEIGFELGFGEPAYFNEFFKRLNGQTPGNYRMS